MCPSAVEGDQRLRVLVAEDNDSLREVLCSLLVTTGFGVVATSDGWEALMLIRSGQRFDVLLFDEEMPRLKGRAALQLLRADGIRTGAVLMSGSADVTAEERARLGIAEVLRKPTSFDELCAALRGAAANAEAPRSRLT